MRIILSRERAACVWRQQQLFSTWLEAVRAMGSAVTVQAAPRTASLLEGEPNEPAVR